MGAIDVPEDAYYGPQTQRAVKNFPVSGFTLPSPFIRALALIKKCAALVNADLQLLDSKRASAIAQAAQEVLDGKFDDQFVVDVFQTGSGTSTHMNMNEVLSSRANEILTGKKIGKSPVHPNDHVNLGQSSNDVVPSALHISASLSIKNDLLPSLEKLYQSLLEKSTLFEDVKKLGRTHLQDAVPMSLGQEFSGYTSQIARGINRMETARLGLAELALGGTAVGTGLNTHPDFASRIITLISKETGFVFPGGKKTILKRRQRRTQRLKPVGD